MAIVRIKEMVEMLKNNLHAMSEKFLNSETLENRDNEVIRRFGALAIQIKCFAVMTMRTTDVLSK